MICLNFEGTPILGDCTVVGHEQWIDCDSISWGVNRTISHSGGGKTRETSNPMFSEITLTKSADMASTELAMQATYGKSLGKAVIHLVNTGGEGATAQIFQEIELEDAIISSYSMGSGGDNPVDTFTVSFNEITTKYNSFDEGGAMTEGDKKGWNLMTSEAT